MKTTHGMIRVNIGQAKTAYWVAGIVFLLGLANTITDYFIPGSMNNSIVAIGNFLFLLPIFMGILIPAKNFTKLMNLGGKRMDFWKSCLPVYVLAALAVSLVSLVLCKFLNPVILHRIGGVMDLFDVFGFMGHGIVAAFFQMSAFLFLAACVAHTLTLIQGRWYGWIVDVLIVAIISVFTPITVLRSALVWFFHMIIFHNSAIVQIVSCVVLGAVVYALSLIPIKSKNV